MRQIVYKLVLNITTTYTVIDFPRDLEHVKLYWSRLYLSDSQNI